MTDAESELTLYYREQIASAISQCGCMRMDPRSRRLVHCAKCAKLLDLDDELPGSAAKVKGALVSR